MLRRIILLLISFSFINAQIALPTFQAVHKTHTAEAEVSCDQSITITTSDEGWYSSSGTAWSITLRLGLELFYGNTKTHTIYDVSTDHDDLVASSSGSSGVTIFNDLGGGNSYASRSISSSDNGTVIEHTFNAQGIADFNNAAGGWFSIGTAVSEGTVRFGNNMNQQISTLVITYSN